MKAIDLYDRIRPWPGRWPGILSEALTRLLLAIPFAGMILVTRLGFRFVGDEGFFHVKVINAFAEAWPTPSIADYSSASTPLPYIIWTIYGKAVGFEIWKLRLLAAVITYAGTNLFYDLCKRHDLPYPLLSTLLFLFFPYVFFHGFTIYTVSFGLLFGIWALHYYLPNEPSLSQLKKGSLLATLAIYCRQYYLALPAGMLLSELLRTPWRGSLPTIGQRFRRWLIISLPMLLVLPLFWLWGGFTPPQHQTDHFLHPVLQHLNFMPILIGFYFLPILVSPRSLELLRFRKVVVLALVLLLPLYCLFPLIHDEEPGRIAAATGVVAHGLDLLRQVLGRPIAAGARFTLWASGLFIFASEVTDCPWSPVKSRLLALLAAFSILITLTPFVSERYYVLTVPYLILLLHRSFRQRRLLLLWLAVQIALSIGFAYYQIAVKSFELWH